MPRKASQAQRVMIAARGFAHAAQRAGDATGPEMLAAIIDQDAAFHGLLVELEEPCHCDLGTCENPANQEDTADA